MLTTVPEGAQLPIATTVFRMADQQRFAEFSGDFNPLHLDPTASRRTQAGAPSVHGMHQVLWALNHLTQFVPRSRHVKSLQARFLNFILADQTVQILRGELTQDAIRLRIVAGATVCTQLLIRLADGDINPDDRTSEIQSHYQGSESCQNPAFDDLANASGDLPVQFIVENAELMFPGAAKLIGATRVHAIAALSRLVGMLCPGLRSVFSAIDLNLIKELEDKIHYFVITADRRYSFLRQYVKGGGIDGLVDAFQRVPPTHQPSASYIRRFVDSKEFSHSSALIVGASRGLGEFAAKTIGAGGGRVIATYHVGRDECEGVANEVRQIGGMCDVLNYDVRKPACEQLRAIPSMPRSMYYFATGRILMHHSDIFDRDRFIEFTDVYLKSFFDLCAHLRSRGLTKLAVFYPSTIAVASRPAEMGLYAMAKAAGEVLCDEISQRWPGFLVTVERLPRLRTDQTATVLNVATPPIEDILIPIIRKIEGLAAEHSDGERNSF